ncbi:MAG: winged helix-turn-helix transcriptional regulator [Candidatus Odinarchaeota archaeon]|nr:winged helix-turn-helix transcriptional regulator [Candidatus Odinarchaeota archaeon]
MGRESTQEKVLSALSNSIRLEIIRMLYERGNEMLTRDDIEKALQSLHEMSEDSSEQFLSSKTINFHLKKLHEAGLIQRYKHRYQLTELGREADVFLFKISEFLSTSSAGEYRRSVGSYIRGSVMFRDGKEVDQFMERIKMERFFTIIRDEDAKLELRWLDSRFWSSIILRRGTNNRVIFSSEVRLFEDEKAFDLSKEEDENIMIKLAKAVNNGILSYIILNAKKVSNSAEITVEETLLR